MADNETKPARDEDAVPPAPVEGSPLPDETPGDAAPRAGGWLSRLRSVVTGDDVEAPPPVPRDITSAPQDELPPTPGFQAPPRPAILDTPPTLAGPAPVAAPETSTEATTPEEPEALELAPASEAIAPEHVAPEAAEGAASEAEPGAPESDAEGVVDAAIAATMENPAAAPRRAWRFGQFITTEPEAPALQPAGEPTADLNAEDAHSEIAQPALFTTQPAEPQPVIDDLEPLPSAELVAQAIEDAIGEATALIEHPRGETPEEIEFPPVPPLTAIAGDLPLPDPDAEMPAEEAEEQREAELIAKGGPFSRFAWPSHPRYWNASLAVMTGLATVSFLMFLLVEPSPRWILLVVALGVAAGMDGVLRATWRAAFERGEDTTPYLFLPALYVFAAPLMIEHNVTGHTVVAWGLAAGLGFGAMAVAEVFSVRTGSPLYPYARMVTTGAAYFAAFALLAMTYILDLGLIPAVIATWFIGTMLAIEVVREGEVDAVETAVFAALVGLVLAQVRGLLFYLPLDGYLAGLALVLVFYFATGVLHSYVLRQLNAITATEYALVTAIGMVLVGAARVAGLA